MSTGIAQHFLNYFSLSIADTPELQKEVYRIRYQVYCEELEYEPKENFPDGMEIDIYDQKSIHYLLKHNSTESYAGCVRVVLPEKQQCRELQFPWQQVITENDHTINNQDNICEISRLAVKSQFRKRQGEQNSATGQVLFPPDSTGKRRFPIIAVSLYWTSICLALQMNLNILAIMEPRLARHLKRFGIASTLSSNLFEYHGKRGLFLIEPKEIINSLDPDIKNLFSLLNSIVKDDLSNLDNSLYQSSISA